MKHMGSLAGKIAVVTGGASGIGAATARLFATQGATVIIGDILADQGRHLADELGENAHYQHLDVSDEASWQALVADTRKLGSADILVNNAAIAIAATVVGLSKRGFEKVLGVNLVGAFLGIKHLAPRMIERRKGSIVNISSNQGLIASNAMAAYASSKWGMRGLAKTAALELGLHGVRVNTVFPGPVNTKLGNPTGMSEEEINRHEALKKQPIQRIGRPEEVAQVCLFLAGDDASYVTGAEVTVDGGMTIGQYMDFLPGGPAG
jgi:3alpha(or 20beta)-hydroxysteroid dehydrogenase